MPMKLPDPIAGRECGACTACCVEMAVDDPALKKPANQACPHMRGGCAIHDHLPETCRHWYCGWRFLNLSDAMRPDRSRILLSPELGNTPGYEKGGLRVVLMENDRAALRNEELLALIARCVQGGVPIFLSWGEGDFAKRALVNEQAVASVKAGDKPGFVAALEELLEGLARQVVMDVIAAQNRPR